MELTKQQAIELHRKLWNYIADETERTKRCISKLTAMQQLGVNPDSVANCCFCCEYASQFDWPLTICAGCPIEWPKLYTYGETRCSCSYYASWTHAYCSEEYAAAARFARIIAELPERF